MTELPPTSFGEIAAHLTESADQAARTIELAKSQPWAHGPGTQAELAALAVDVRIAGQLAALFAAIEPHEELVRDFLTGLLNFPMESEHSAERRQA